MNKNYVNFHCHSSYSNISTPDSTISNRDRAMRVLELGQSTLSGIEHGWMGRIIEIIELSKEFGLKPLLGTEAYFVKNRFEKDKNNAHLILLAKNENGRKSINRILSEANISGFYYKPRIDLELLLSLPKNDVWVSSACIGGIWKYDDYENLVIDFHNHFQENFFLEVQNHNVDSQKYWNTRMLDLSHKYNISILAGMDSHMIYPNQAKERDDYLLSRGISYPDEENWYLDFPSYEDAALRFELQGILNKNQIEECLENTNIFNDVQECNSIIFNPDIIKLPSLYIDKTQEEKNQILKNLIYDKWNDEKNEIPPENWQHYEEEIAKELNIVFETKMSDYFLLDYEIVKKGVEAGGQITLTGRGSAPSFFLSKLLGFTTIDRISASVKLFPERFISAERLLETKSLPDIDLNLGNPEVFAEAQKQVMGNGHSYPMVAFGTVKDAGAWKLYSRISDIDFETANKVSEQIQKYEIDLKHAESDEEKESLNILDYIDKKYHDVYNESRKYLGLINSVTPHPCAYLIFNHGDIREEFGLIKIKTGNVEHICACCDGLFAENYKLLKNDLLKVAVVKLIHETYNRIGIKPHSISELLKLCHDNQNVWDVYANGWTKGINQFEQSGTRGRATKYKPKNISELSAFVAAIRPGFKSNYSIFESRQPFEYGVRSLDQLIQTPEFLYSFMLYQENAMQVLAYAGIPISKTYEIIKNIAKKRVEKVKKYKDKFVSGMKKRLINDENIDTKEAENIANMTWQIIDDSSHYSFNASHSYSVAGDSLYGAYLKSHYPLQFYETFLNILEDDGDKDRLSEVKNEAEEAYNIQFPSLRYGQDNRKIVANIENGEINQSLKILKGFGDSIGQKFYELSQQFQGDDFLELLIYAEENGFLSSKWDTLIKINFFENFGHNKKLYTIYKEFVEGNNQYKKTYVEKTKIKRLDELKRIWYDIPNERIPFVEQLENEFLLLGSIQSTYPNINGKYAYVLDVDIRYAPRIQVYGLKRGKQTSLKLYRATFASKEFDRGTILFCNALEQKSPIKMVDGKYLEDTHGVPQWWLTSYTIIKPEEFDKILQEK